MTQATPNPARILRELVREAAARGESVANNPSIRTWSKTLGSPGGGAELGRRLGEVLSLVAEVRREMSRHATESEVEAVNPALELLETYIVNQDRSWGEHWTMIDGPHLLALLAMAAGILDREDTVKLVVTNVEALRDHLAELIEEVLASSLETDVKAEVRMRLAALVDYLEHAGTGSTKIFEVLAEAGAGRLLGDPALAAKLNQDPTGKKVVGVLAGLMLLITGRHYLLPSEGMKPAEEAASSTVVLQLCESGQWSPPALNPAPTSVGELGTGGIAVDNSDGDPETP